MRYSRYDHMAIKIIVEKHPDGYIAYSIGMSGVVLGEGDTYEEALADVTSAIRFHVETFGAEASSIASACN
jgi:predicted RNase H-like HicB family nuclease